jgi:hypothetical protein
MNGLSRHVTGRLSLKDFEFTEGPFSSEKTSLAFEMIFDCLRISRDSITDSADEIGPWTWVDLAGARLDRVWM